MNEQETPVGMNTEEALVLIAHLKEAREKRSWSLENLADRTRISLHVLGALENGDFSVVEAPFVRAFLKAYAQQVGVSADEVNAVFPESKARVEEPEEEDRSIPIVPRSRIPWGVLARVGVVVLAGVLLWVWAPWSTRQPAPVPAERIASAVAVPRDTASKTDTAAVDSALARGADSANVEDSDEPVLRPIAPPAVVSRQRQSGRLAITARESLWVQVADMDSQQVYDRIMIPNMREEWEVTQTLRIALGRHWAAQVSFNGQVVEVPHGTGNSTVFYCSPRGVSRRPGE